MYLSVPDLEEGHMFEPPAKGTLWRVVGLRVESGKLYIIFEAVQQSVETDGTFTCAHCGRKYKGNQCTNCGFGATYQPRT